MIKQDQLLKAHQALAIRAQTKEGAIFSKARQHAGFVERVFYRSPATYGLEMKTTPNSWRGKGPPPLRAGARHGLASACAPSIKGAGGSIGKAMMGLD